MELETHLFRKQKIWPILYKDHTARLKGFIGVINGHLFEIHTRIYSKEENEKTEHLHCHCPKFKVQRLEFLGKHYLENKSSLISMSIYD